MSDPMPDPKPVPPNTVRACVIPGAPQDVAAWIRPCTPQRDWMEAIPQKYIYRCVPMVAANTMGWEILNPVDARVRWSGGMLNPDVSVSLGEENPFGAASHFGGGVVTWYLPFLFRSSPDLGLMVTGPANHDHDNAAPLDAFVRTDWLPFPFTMNWRLTRKDEEVIFKAGEPICRIYPFPIALLDHTTLELTRLDDDPGLVQQVNEFGAARQQNVARQQADATRWMETGEAPTGDGVWNSQYVRAKSKSTEDGYSPHQTVFRVKKPVDTRP